MSLAQDKLQGATRGTERTLYIFQSVTLVGLRAMIMIHGPLTANEVLVMFQVCSRDLGRTPPELSLFSLTALCLSSM